MGTTHHEEGLPYVSVGHSTQHCAVNQQINAKYNLVGTSNKKA